MSNFQVVQRCITIYLPGICVSIRPRFGMCSNVLPNRMRSVILSHFILDLRCNMISCPIPSCTQSTVDFVRKAEDGFGGTLNSFWQGYEDGEEEDNTRVFSSQNGSTDAGI